MASLRALRPVLRHSTVLRTTAPRRFLNAESSPSLYAAHASVTGARNGHIESEGLTLDLTMPSSLTGKDSAKGKTNPEELFAAGYGACFQSAMNAVAPSLGLKMPSKPEDAVLETTVHLIGDMKALDIGIRVDMKVKVKGVGKGDLERLVQKTKEVCPYSRATKRNVVTNVTVESS